MHKFFFFLSRSNLKILGARRVTLRNFHTEGPKIFGATEPNLITQATWCPGCRQTAHGVHTQKTCTGEDFSNSKFCVNLLLLPFALQPTAGFGLSNNILPFFPICHQLSPSSHSQHLKISFYFLFPAFPGSSSSSRPFQFLSEDLFGHPIILHSL